MSYSHTVTVQHVSNLHHKSLLYFVFVSMVNSLTPSSPHSIKSPALSKPKISRAPIQNPFDKFTQSEYDAWIAKLIGHIDKALAYDDIPFPEKSIPFVTAEASYAGSFMPKPAQESEDDLDNNIEDSFAQVKARRVNKGKGRDPREGPGLRPDSGGQNKPIEILSDEEQDSGQVLDSERSEGEEEEEEGEEERAYDEDEYEDEDDDDEQVGTSAWAEKHWNRRKHVETDEGEEYYEEYDEESNQAASVRREDSEQNTKTLSDTKPTIRQQEEGRFLSDEESADTHSSSPQSDDYVGGMHSSPPQFDENDISDQVTCEFSQSTIALYPLNYIVTQRFLVVASANFLPPMFFPMFKAHGLKLKITQEVFIPKRMSSFPVQTSKIYLLRMILVSRATNLLLNSCCLMSLATMNM